MFILRYNIFQFCLLSKLIINSSAQDVTFPRPRVPLVDGWKARELNIVFWPLQGIFLHHFMTKKFCTKNYFWHRIEPSLMSTNIYILVWGKYNPTKFVFQNPNKKSVWQRFAVTPDFFLRGGGYYDQKDVFLYLPKEVSFCVEKYSDCHSPFNYRSGSVLVPENVSKVGNYLINARCHNSQTGEIIQVKTKLKIIYQSCTFSMIKIKKF